MNIKNNWTGFLCLIFVAMVWTGCDNKKSESASEITDNATEERHDTIGRGTPVVQVQDSIIEETSSEETEQLHPVYMGMWGAVGGTGFLFDMDGTKGSYIPYDMGEAKEYGERRQLELVSYDPKSGNCIINAFLRGKYIGQFKGIFEEDEVELDEGGSHAFQAYNGTFTSDKGAVLKFHFHFD